MPEDTTKVVRYIRNIGTVPWLTGNLGVHRGLIPGVTNLGSSMLIQYFYIVSRNVLNKSTNNKSQPYDIDIHVQV